MPITVFFYNEKIAVFPKNTTLKKIIQTVQSKLPLIYDLLSQHSLTRDLFAMKKLTAYYSNTKAPLSQDLLPAGQYKVMLCLVQPSGQPVKVFYNWYNQEFDPRVSSNSWEETRIMITPQWDGQLLLPITLVHGQTRIELPHEIATNATAKEVLNFINKHPKIYQEIARAVQASYFVQKLLKVDVLKKEKDLLQFQLLNPETNTIIKEDEVIGKPELIIAPILCSNPYQLVLPPEPTWFYAHQTGVLDVCQVYSGKKPGELRDINVDHFISLYRGFKLDLTETELAMTATSVVSYCIDTQQTYLLNKHPHILEDSFLSPEHSELKGHESSAVNDSSSTPIGLDAIVKELHKGHSSSLSFSLFRSKKNDPLLSDLKSQIERKHRADSSSMTNFLTSRLAQASTSKLFNPKGRSATAIHRALKLARNLPENICFTQYHNGFFSKSSQMKIKRICGEVNIPPDLADIVLNYLQKIQYLRCCFAIPAGMLAEITKKYPSQEFDNHIITQSCKIILEELRVANAHGLMIGPDRLSDIRRKEKRWSLNDTFKEIEYPTSTQYVYFALPTRGVGEAGHAIAIVIDRTSQVIYFIDSMSNEENIKEALAQLEPLTSKRGSFEGYEIKYPPAGTLLQQQGGVLCGAYTVSNIIGLITQLSEVDISPYTLGFQPGELIANSQIDLDTWTQKKPLDIEMWKYLIILTTQEAQQLQDSFYEQMVKNYNMVQTVTVSPPSRLL
jgi:hypothetical protein